MTERRVYVHAAAALGPQLDYRATQRRRLQADPDSPDLKALSRELLGQTLRQASHFVELATLGARLCLNALGQPPAAGCAIYLGTGLAEVRKTSALFKQVMPPLAGPASPFDFISAANNMAAFYVAKLAGMSSRNLTITQEEFSFEHALELAYQDLRHGAVPAALVGGVDERAEERAQQMRRIRLHPQQIMGEGSAWLYLTTEANGALGELIATKELDIPNHRTSSDWARAVAERLARLHLPDDSLCVLPGFRLDDAMRAALTQVLPNARQEDYLPYCGCYPSATAFGLATRLESMGDAPYPIVHINRDSVGQTMMVVLRVFARNRRAT